MKRLTTALVACLMATTFLPTPAFSAEVIVSLQENDFQICGETARVTGVVARIAGSRSHDLYRGNLTYQADLNEIVEVRFYTEPRNKDSVNSAFSFQVTDMTIPVVIEASMNSGIPRLNILGVTKYDDGIDEQDVDDDGDGYSENQGDCVDWDDNIHPGATEVCDNVDNDCDDIVDEGFDQDGDGHFQCDHHGIEADCDDSDATVYPGADDADAGVSGSPPEILDTDGDGLLDTEDLCPEDAEDIDNHLDGDGCPDPDNDGDGILDRYDGCPDRLETLNGFQDEDGCPDELPPNNDDIDWGDDALEEDESDLLADALTGGENNTETTVPEHLAGDDEQDTEPDELTSRGGGHDDREEESETMRATHALAAAAIATGVIVGPTRADGQDGPADTVPLVTQLEGADIKGERTTWVPEWSSQIQPVAAYLLENPMACVEVRGMEDVVGYDSGRRGPALSDEWWVGDEETSRLTRARGRRERVAIEVMNYNVPARQVRQMGVAIRGPYRGAELRIVEDCLKDQTISIRGADGYSCWDLNQNWTPDVDTEDMNRDGVVNLRDCDGIDGRDGKDALSTVYIGLGVLPHNMNGGLYVGYIHKVAVNVTARLGFELSIPQRWLAVGGYFEAGATARNQYNPPPTLGGAVTVGFDPWPYRRTSLNVMLVPIGYISGGVYWNEEERETDVWGQAFYGGLDISVRLVNRLRLGGEIRLEYPYKGLPWNMGFGLKLTWDLFRYSHGR